MDEGIPRALSILLRAFGPDARSRLLGAFPPDLRESTLVCLDADPLPPRDQSIVEQILSQDLERIVGDEPDQPDGLVEARPLQVADLMAIVFLHGSPQAAAEMIPHLPESLQTEAIRTLCTQSWDAFERHVGHDEAAFVAEFDRSQGKEVRRTDPDFACAVLSSVVMVPNLRRILTALYRLDPGAANQQRAKLFTVLDLDRLSDGELQIVLVGIDDWDLAMAMNGFPRRLFGRVLVNVSERRAKLLEDDVAYLSETEVEKIDSVHRLILERARGLYESGRITTYLGSIAAADDPVEESTEVSPQGGKRTRKAPVEEEERSRIPLFAAGVGLVLLSVAWLNWFGTSPHERRGAGTGGGVSVEDYVRKQGAGAGASEGGGLGGLAGRTTQGQVRATKGSVLVYTESDTLPLGEQPILPGQEIVTGKDGEAVLSVRDEARAHLGNESAVRVGEGKVHDPRLRVRLGRVWIRVNDPRIVVASPVASIVGSEGAVYELRVVLSSAPTVRVKDGTAWVTARLGEDEEQLVVASGRYVLVDPRHGIDTGPLTEGSEPTWLGLF